MTIDGQEYRILEMSGGRIVVAKLAKVNEFGFRSWEFTPIEAVIAAWALDVARTRVGAPK